MTLGKQGIQKMLKGIQINKIQKDRMQTGKNIINENSNLQDGSKTPQFGLKS